MTEHEGELLVEIAALRRRNNNLWMRIVEIALTHAPMEVKPIMKQIGEIDREVTNRWSELAK